MANFFDQFDATPAGGGGSTLDKRARDFAIRTIYGEAANEPEEGQAAVAHVIRNRMQAGRYGGDTVEGVVRARNQFEPWNTQGGQMRMRSLREDDPRYQAIGRVVDGVFGGQMADPTSGATHFFAPKAQAALGRNVPAWGREGGQPIGNHTFFAPEGRVTFPATEVSAAQRAPAASSNFFDQFDGPAAEPAPTPTAAPGANGVTRVTVTPREPPPQAAINQFGDVGQPADIGRGNAFLRGALQGVSANFGDELAGIAAAAGDTGIRIPGLPISTSNIVGLGRLGYEWLSGSPGEATKRYEQGRDAVRADLKAAKAQYPGTALTGEIGGAIAMPGGALLNAATLPARMARGLGVGAAYGGLAGLGEGETADQRATKGASGALIGGAVGGLAPPVIAGVGAVAGGVANRVIEPVRNALRGSAGVENEAQRRVAGAIQKDLDNGGWEALDRASNVARARSQGMPVANADLGNDKGLTGALARSAADTSPEGRAAMTRIFDDRYEGQYARVRDWVNTKLNFPDSLGWQKAIDAAEKQSNPTRYAAAMRNPNARDMWDEGLQELATAPAVQTAMKQANVASRNRAANAGSPQEIAQPFVTNPQTGEMTLRVLKDGSTAKPSLAFWDAVKKNLDKGNGEAQQLSRTLRDHLDGLVPEYAKARAGAKAFFDAEDALQAGRNFVSQQKDLRQAAEAFRKLNPMEQKLFQDGFMSDFLEKLGNVGDRRDILRKINDNPNARAKIEMVLGPGKWKELEARLHVEGIMNGARNAIQGGSNTSRNLYQAGLAGGGGIGAYGGYNMDPQTATYGAVLAAISTRGKNVDQRIAKRVAELLSSNDPAALAKGIKIVTSDSALMRAIRNFDPSGRIAGREGTGLPVLQAAGVSRAEDQQPEIPRPPRQ